MELFPGILITVYINDIVSNSSALQCALIAHTMQLNVSSRYLVAVRSMYLKYFIVSVVYVLMNQFKANSMYIANLSLFLNCYGVKVGKNILCKKTIFFYKYYIGERNTRHSL